MGVLVLCCIRVSLIALAVCVCVCVCRIDHWDVARERVVFMTKKNLYSIRYDFVSCCVSEIKSIPLAIIDEMLHGDISYSKFCVV